MNDKFTNNMDREDETIAQKLDWVASQTNINAQFASELEERLRNTHRPKVSWFSSSFKQVSPTLRWVGLVILLGLVLNWSIRTLIPAPQPATDNTPVNSDIATSTPDVVPNETATPITQSGGYDWRGTKLYLATPLPELPTEANVYLLKPDHHTTVEEAQALAQRFEIEGTIYQAPGELAGTTDYLVTDGKQRLYVRSENYFTYYADYSTWVILFGGKNISEEQAYTAIDTFLKSHGFDFEYQIEKEYRTNGEYYVIPLTADGHTIRFDYDLPARLQVIVGSNGQVIFVESNRINDEPVGTYDLITAAEAFQKLLNASETAQNGVVENTQSGGILNESIWNRSYPDTQTVTLYGRVTAFDSVESGQPPFVSIESYTATGNTPPGSDQLIEATGQFHTENGIRKFNVETWKVTDATETSIMGTLERNGEQTLLTSDLGDKYIFTDIPADVPLNTKTPDEQLIFTGVMTSGNFIWNSIQYFPVGSNFGGGGGGGTGFYQLNLSGTPVPFPTPTLQPETNQGTVEYVVKEGDTIFAIAQAYDVTPDEIFQANRWLDGGVLAPGKTLIIPGAQANLGPSEYIVQENDTLGSIALNFGIPVDELMQANDITDNTVFTGQTLIIPQEQVTSGQGITLPEEQLPHLEIGQRLEDKRGIFQVNSTQKSDGSQTIWYGFYDLNGKPSIYYILQGTDLQSLQAYNNLPMDIWGTVDHVDELGRPIVKVDRYEVPYPDLQFQIFEGTQQIAEIQGQSVILFMAKDGKTYVELTGIGTPFDRRGIFGKEDDQILVEGLAIPDETFGDYPCLRVFSVNYLIDPASGQPNEMTITANQVNIYEEPPASVENYTHPTATIEKVELVYYTPDPRYTLPDPNASPQYIQPAWRFYGHYSNGNEFEILVQALKQEYLLPELAPYTPPG
jgi:LysM repeat protein